MVLRQIALLTKNCFFGGNVGKKFVGEYCPFHLSLIASLKKQRKTSKAKSLDLQM